MASSGPVVLRNREKRVVAVHDAQSDRLAFYTDDSQAAASTRERVGSRSSWIRKCPYCRRPMTQDDFLPRDFSPDMDHDDVQDRGFVDERYFSLLQAYFNEENNGHALPFETEDGEPMSTGGISGVSGSAFNDGYFEKFFCVESSLGRGAKAEVLKVKHVLDGISLGTYAVKRVAVGDSHQWLEKLLQEVQFMRLRHNNIVNYNHVWLEKSRLTAFGPEVPTLHILQEYCNGGNLQQYITNHYKMSTPDTDSYASARERKSQARKARTSSASSHGRPRLHQDKPEDLPVSVVFSIFKDILSGVEFLQSQGVIHRDLKPSNCLLNFGEDRNQIPRVLVSDFGEGQLQSLEVSATNLSLSLPYTAPELLRGTERIPTFESDVFSLGIILHFLVFRGSLPWQHEEADSYDDLKEEIINWPGFRPRTDSIPEELNTLLVNMTHPDAKERWSCKKILLLMNSMESKVANHDTNHKVEVRRASDTDATSSTHAMALPPIWENMRPNNAKALTVYPKRQPTIADPHRSVLSAGIDVGRVGPTNTKVLALAKFSSDSGSLKRNVQLLTATFAVDLIGVSAKTECLLSTVYVASVMVNQTFN